MTHLLTHRACTFRLWDRFVRYSNLIKIARHTGFHRDLETVKEWQAQLPNLRAINYDSYTRRHGVIRLEIQFDCTRHGVSVTYPALQIHHDLRFRPVTSGRFLPQSGCGQAHTNPLDACPILRGIDVRFANPDSASNLCREIGRQLSFAMKQMADPKSGLTIPHDWICLRSLTLLWDKAFKDQGIKLGDLEHILKYCPELEVVRCRLTGKEAKEAEESRLDPVFASPIHLEVLHLETHGRVLPYLAAIKRFAEVTLICSPILTPQDKAHLNDASWPAGDRSRLQHLTFRAHHLKLAAKDSIPSECNPTDVASLIQRLIPRSCIVRFAVDEGLKEPESLWW